MTANQMILLINAVALVLMILGASFVWWLITKDTARRLWRILKNSFMKARKIGEK